MPTSHATATDEAIHFVGQINEIIIYPLIFLLTAVALLVFIWGGFQFVNKSADPAARAEGRKHLMWGIIGLTVMMSAYGILKIASNTIGVSAEDSAKGVFPAGFEI